MVIWNTKYALTTGIIREEGCEIKEVNGTDYAYRPGAHYGKEDYLFLQLGKTAFKTEKEARTDAVKQARRKLASIEKQRVELEKRLADWNV